MNKVILLIFSFLAFNYQALVGNGIHTDNSLSLSDKKKIPERIKSYHSLVKLIEDKDSPFIYNEHIDEVQIRLKNRSYAVYYDPFTGEFIGSGRGRLFYEIDHFFWEKFSQKFYNLENEEDVVKKLGSPDEIFTQPDVKQLNYYRFHEENYLVIQVNKKTGKITNISMSGKQKNKNITSHKLKNDKDSQRNQATQKTSDASNLNLN